MGYSASDLADFVGVTRQTINNLETGKTKMSPTLYISLAAVVDNYIMNNGEMFNAIKTIIDGNKKKRNESYDTSFSNVSLLKRWFACFKEPVDFNSAAMTYENMEEYGSLLQRLAGKYKVFIDTDVFFDSKSGDFLNMFSGYLVTENAKFIIPKRVTDQLLEMMQEVSASEKAINALKKINELQQKNIVQIRGEDSDSNVHDTILSVFAKFRSLHRLCLITQNEPFANEVKHLNESSEKQGFDIVIGFVDENGLLSLYPRPMEESLSETSMVINNIGVDEEECITKAVAIEKPSNLMGWEQL